MSLTIEKVSAGYVPGATVVREVDLTVGGGEAVGIIGRNGAGKSCLAQAVIGMTALHAGRVLLGDADLSTASPRGRVRAGLALVPEGRQVFPQLTIRENLQMAAYGAGRRLSREVWDDVCETFPILRTKADDRAGTMSGGEQQWLALGRALVQAPTAVVFDEPSLGLSPVAIAGVAEALLAFRERGVAVVLMEQNPYLLERVCDQVLLLDRGRVDRELDLAGADADLVARAYLG